jgi:hypothetical protein
VRRLAVALLAAATAMATLACSGDAETQAQRDPNAPAPETDEVTLPLAPDVDPCQLSPDVIGLLAGLTTEPGTFTGTGEAAGQCVYAEADGDQLVITVDTSDGGDAYDDANNTTTGEDIDSVGDEAFWNDPTLYLVSDGHFWTFTLNTAASDAIRRQTVAIAVAQALDL